MVIRALLTYFCGTHTGIVDPFLWYTYRHCWPISVVHLPALLTYFCGTHTSIVDLFLLYTYRHCWLISVVHLPALLTYFCGTLTSIVDLFLWYTYQRCWLISVVHLPALLTSSEMYSVLVASCSCNRMPCFFLVVNPTLTCMKSVADSPCSALNSYCIMYSFSKFTPTSVTKSH